jgi:hydrogenase-1 operon protein HyaE
MTTSLIEALVARHGFAVVDEASLDAFLEAHEHALLFFPGDAERLVESSDVAVILPEILKIYRGKIAPALVAKSAERALQRRFRFNAFPSVVFMRGTGYLGVISRVLDWQQYLAEIPEILARAATEPPPFRFPDGCYTAGMPREPGTQIEGDPL